MGLGERAVAVLAALVERPNEYVRKERLLEIAWSGVVVEEGNLPVQISAIRHALAQVPGGEHWVETLARRGYRFVGPVTRVQEAASQGTVGGRERSNLSVALTSFIGRERELVEVKRLLSGKRLLTIVGIGGIGKTRLALQVAAEVMEAYHDGVWVVELGSLGDPLLVPTSVARVLGVQEKTNTSLTDTLRAAVHRRQLLLVLDNCEHLLEACAALTDAILRASTETTVIATSREPLHVAGEQVYPLHTLSLPDRTADTESIGRAEAVQLFVERAKRQLPDFELSAARAPAVAELCIHLDGIPLALELAAARVRSLSIEQINDRLHDRFKLLTGGTRTSLPRQQTLRATLDWSYDPLGEQERAVLRRLGIFAGGFTLEAAAAVVSDDASDEFAVIDLLSQLVGRSLVVSDTGDAGVRYKLLETTRAYAMEKLVEAGEIGPLRRRHALYFRDRFRHAYDDGLHMPDAEWRATYVPELDNVRAAIDWALGVEGDSAIGIAVAGASGAMWAELSLPGEGRRRLEAASAQVGPGTPEVDQALLCLWLGLLQRYSAPSQAMMHLERAIELYRCTKNAAALGHSLTRLGAILCRLGRLEESAGLLAEAFRVLEHSGAPKALGFYFTDLAILKMLTGDLVAARTHYRKAVALFRESGAQSAALAILGNLGDVTWALGDLDAAAGAFAETVALLRKAPLTRKDILGNNIMNLAGVCTERGELEDALAFAREGLPLLQEGGYAWNTLDHLALRAALAGKVVNAARIVGYADSAHAANAATRQPNEARARARLQVLVLEKLQHDEFDRLVAEGARMSEDEVCRLALEG